MTTMVVRQEDESIHHKMATMVVRQEDESIHHKMTTMVVRQSGQSIEAPCVDGLTLNLLDPQGTQEDSIDTMAQSIEIG